MPRMKKLILCLFLFFVAVLIKPMEVSAAETFLRLGGQDRYDTSVRISEQYWSKSLYVVLASGDDFPDALCATPLAKKCDAPILLTSKNSISDGTINEIKRLKPELIYIVGGTGAISDDIQSELQGMGINCIRLGGKNRYETSVAVAKEVGTSSNIVVASGENFPDALSIAPYAASKGMPIILSSNSSLDATAKTYIANGKVGKTYVIGGYSVISKDVESQLPGAVRLYGDTRYSTNIAVIKEFNKESNFSTIFTAAGTNYPDALAGSAAAAINATSPVFLVDKSTPQEIKDYVSTVKPNMNEVVMLGGMGAMPSSYVRGLLSEPAMRVVLDAGHGGYDSGAVGYSGTTYEKNDTIAVALKAGSILQQNGVDVVYTRTDDNVSWPSNEKQDLQARCDIAAKAEADYFVAIHCDSFQPNPAANGTSTFYYGSNSTGQALAQTVQNAFIKAVGSYDRDIKTANYYVLKYNSMPAILIEIGFISNANEEKLLASPDYQQKCAQGIANGILEFVEK